MNHDLHTPEEPASPSGERTDKPASGTESDPRDEDQPTESTTPGSSRNSEQEAEEIARKIAEIERKVADGN
ncbi:hypothetical protein ACQKQA_03570 [Pseudomonas sp. NPDC089530]|uniref:hypothetical protein n=1 Tax=Pseudomonas sp. NPDC089530 TaxID=3390651 RepID=UPI003D04F76E